MKKKTKVPAGETSPAGAPSSMVSSRARLTTFAVLYISYCGYYLCRKNYTFWMAAVVRESNLTPVQAGLSSSAFQMAQATARLVLAVWIDTHSPRHILAGGLVVSAVLNVGMCFVTFSPLAMALLWGVNGVVQSRLASAGSHFYGMVPSLRTRQVVHSALHEPKCRLRACTLHRRSCDAVDRILARCTVRSRGREPLYFCACVFACQRYAFICFTSTIRE